MNPPPNSRALSFGWAALVLQMLAVAAVLWRTGRLSPQSVPDTAGYVAFPWESLSSVLQDMRTPGYPLFLKFASLFGPEHAAAPTLQMLAFFAATALLFAVLSLATESMRSSLAAASALLYANILHGYVPTLATDTLAAGLGVAACAATIAFVSNNRLRTAVALGCIVALAWLVRPAYLFLVVLCPVLAFLSAPHVVQAIPGSRGQLFLKTLAVVVIPLLAYCGLRWSTVGQFGIVSFGGYNLVGVTGQFLEEADLPGLPDDLRPIASAALANRQQAGPRGPHGHEPRLHYLRMETEYDPTIWSDFVPAAARQPATEGPVNVRLRRLGMGLLTEHVREYGVWVIKATRQGAKKLVWDFLDNPVYLLASGLLVGLLLVRIALPSRSAPLSSESLSSLKLLTGLGLSYAVLNLAVVVPVCPPLGRFTDAAAVFLAAPLFAKLTTLPTLRRHDSNGRGLKDRESFGAP